MPFDPKQLPAKVYESYKLGLWAWPLTVQEALDHGILDLNRLTDIVFYLHHPDLVGRSLKADETGLINKWKLYRGLVGSRQAEYRQRARSAAASQAAMAYDGSTGGEHSSAGPYDPTDRTSGVISDPNHPSHGVLPTE